MKDTLAAIGALCVGCTFVIIVLAILASMRDRTERRARERQQLDREATDHIRRFSAAMAVLDMDEYRARKANGSSAGHAASEPSHSVAEAAKPRAESLITEEASING